MDDIWMYLTISFLFYWFIMPLLFLLFCLIGLVLTGMGICCCACCFCCDQSKCMNFFDRILNIRRNPPHSSPARPLPALPPIHVKNTIGIAGDTMLYIPEATPNNGKSYILDIIERSVDEYSWKEVMTGSLKVAIGGDTAFHTGNKDLVAPNRMIVYAPSNRNAQPWKNWGVEKATNKEDILKFSTIIFLAMKPQHLGDALKMEKVGEEDVTRKIFVSVIAGLSLDTLKESFFKYGIMDKNRSIRDGYNSGFVRAIPNINMQIHLGCTVICRDEASSDGDVNMVKKLLQAGGMCEEIPESLMAVAGSLSGCVPAFAFSIIEGFSDGAVKEGMPRELSYKLAAQSLMGAAALFLQELREGTCKHPGILRDRVCSPGGTTISGIHALEKGGLRGILMDAIECSTDKARILNDATKKK